MFCISFIYRTNFWSVSFPVLRSRIRSPEELMTHSGSHSYETGAPQVRCLSPVLFLWGIPFISRGRSAYLVSCLRSDWSWFCPPVQGADCWFRATTDSWEMSTHSSGMHFSLTTELCLQIPHVLSGGSRSATLQVEVLVCTAGTPQKSRTNSHITIKW